jgi:hypothetical protein
MDLDVDIENIEFLDDEQRLQESREVAAELQLKNKPFQKRNISQYKMLCLIKVLKN